MAIVPPLRWTGRSIPMLLLFRLAFVSEMILHGKPSGIDNTVSTFGGFIEFSNFLPTVVDFAPPIKVLLVNTQVKRNTRTLVEKVAKQYQVRIEISLAALIF